ncbi:MAG TPA: cytosolic protein, partial [Thiotrichaceae bacterium]|nr:cytosolic protein [Thiotrichaceae bacterium]
MLENPSTEYDSPWKDIIEHFFEDFMIFFFPKVHE